MFYGARMAQRAADGELRESGWDIDEIEPLAAFKLAAIREGLRRGSPRSRSRRRVPTWGCRSRLSTTGSRGVRRDDQHGPEEKGGLQAEEEVGAKAF